MVGRLVTLRTHFITAILFAAAPLLLKPEVVVALIGLAIALVELTSSVIDYQAAKLTARAD